MALENKLGLTSSADLAREEEQISKKKAMELFESCALDALPAGKFNTLQSIHKCLFEDIYDFAGKLRTVNMAKGNFRFASLMYLNTALENIDKMPQSTFDEIVEKYVEMNIAHPFREGNGRSTRIWLDHMLKTEIGKVVDWGKVDTEFVSEHRFFQNFHILFECFINIVFFGSESGIFIKIFADYPS